MDDIPPSDSPLLKLPHTYRAFYGAFSSLHDTQRCTIDPLLEGQDLILRAATGSGKTEAVLAPALEAIIQGGREGSVAYLVPTRALAIDLERRLKSMLGDRLGLNVGVRTGDAKRRGGTRTDLLLTTPESLDVMVGSGNERVRDFLRRLRVVILDEVHQLLHTYRGKQLAYVLQRLERRTGQRLQRIALSATISDPDAIIAFFGMYAPVAQVLDAVRRPIEPRLIQLKEEAQEFPAWLEDLHDRWQARKILLFANSRKRCDQLFVLADARGPFQGCTELHYSNLKPRERHQAEQRFRRRTRSLCVATSTLELGIDIGDVDCVILYEPPESVSAFLQRIGRANRRGPRVRFWGVCRGPKASDQLLRFCALIQLARQGIIEKTPDRRLPSVLVQQVLSCLYEVKRLSLPSLESLFPEQTDLLEPIWTELKRRRWLREDGLHGLMVGGRPFWDALIERRIWSNFPPSEQDYGLQVADETVADLPRSVVDQLEVGDRVRLAGRQLQVVAIEHGDGPRVLAVPSLEPDQKELFWLGGGLNVTYEVAQGVQALLADDSRRDDVAAALFSRPRKLLEAAQEEARGGHMLANGVELRRSSNGLFLFRTYLGAVGNVFIRTAARELLAEEDLYIQSDAFGVEASLWIDFHRLDLPRDRDGLRRWVAPRARALRSALELNAFFALLPHAVQREELTDLLYDARLLEVFRYYRAHPCVLEVDMDLPGTPQGPGGLAALPVRGVGTPVALLAEEQQRWAVSGPRFQLAPEASFEARSLTGTMVGAYVRHGQCSRHVAVSFLAEACRPPSPVRADTELATLRTERGKAHEAKVLLELAKSGVAVVVVGALGKDGRRRSLGERAEVTRAQLAAILLELREKAPQTVFLAQAVLCQAQVLRRALVALDEGIMGAGSDGRSEAGARGVGGMGSCSVARVSDGSGDTGGMGINRGEGASPEPWWWGVMGVGIPDLIQIQWDGVRFLLEVGDIKDSLAPREDQRWQVAFYASLLQQTLAREASLAPEGTRLELSPHAFLITRAGPSAAGFPVHRFALAPYLSALPMLLHRLRGALNEAAVAAPHRLSPGCVSCASFDLCYREALQEQQVQLIPDMSEGLASHLWRAGVHRWDQVGAWLQEVANLPSEHHSGQAEAEGQDHAQTRLPPEQRRWLEAQVTALQHGQAWQLEAESENLPAGLSAAILLDGLMDPLLGIPRCLCWQVVDRSGKILRQDTWFIPGLEAWGEARAEAVETLYQVWEELCDAGRVPHLLHFGGVVWAGFKGRAAETGLEPFDAPDRPCRTDLRTLLRGCFALPIPGSPNLATVARALGFQTPPPMPESLFHPDVLPEIRWGEARWSQEEQASAEAWMDGRRAAMRAVLGWLFQHVKGSGEVPPPRLRAVGTDLGTAYQRFLTNEARLRALDLRRLSALSLDERVQQGRAIGPLTFVGTRLDDEGRIAYHLASAGALPVTKFRDGDFCRLVVAGATDLQSGAPVILTRLEAARGALMIRPRGGKRFIAPGVRYTLEEDGGDFTGPKLAHGINTVWSTSTRPPVRRLLQGDWQAVNETDGVRWASRWLEAHQAITGLNPSQVRAFLLPFRSSLALIQGPPGTGKTHLLAWICIALIQYAQARGMPARLVISALTHRAIDNALEKIVSLMNQHGLQGMPVRCFKVGRWEASIDSTESENAHLAVEPLQDRQTLLETPHAIVGATGFGVYQLLGGNMGRFEAVFDWGIFDEASQLLVPQAILTLLYVRHGFLFLGDTRQLPPVVRGRYEGHTSDEGQSSNTASNATPTPPVALTSAAHTVSGPAVHQSILEQLSRHYGGACGAMLEVTYRMNREICDFPSRLWYGGVLRPGLEAEDRRLVLSGERRGDSLDWILAPERPVTLVLVDHEGARERSELEAGLLAALAARLMDHHGMGAEALALVAPYRAQNSAIAACLRDCLEAPDATLPVIDTVERLQGAERDVVFFGLTSSDPDVVESRFLNQPNRFNVVMTRARCKLIVVGSWAFFARVARTETGLQEGHCFKQFLWHCLARRAVVRWPGGSGLEAPSAMGWET